MAEGGTLFGLIHDIGDRRKAARVRDVMRQKNYFNDPLGAASAVNDAGYVEQAVSLRDQALKSQAEQAELARKNQTADSERYRGALGGITRALKGARDSGGDLGATFDGLAPVLQKGFGVAPDELAGIRQQITTNPGVIDQYEELFADPTKAKFGVVTPGAGIYDQRTGQITASQPGVAKPITVKRGDGGSDLYVMNPDGSFVPATTGPEPGAGVAGGVGAGSSGGNSRGERNGNPGNIKDGAWAKRQPGYIGSDGTFAKFAPGMGEKAQETLLQNHYVNGQRNVNQIVDKYLGGAANSENSAASQANYKAYVARRLGIDPNAPVPQSMTPQLGQAMREFETGNTVGAGGSRPGIAPVASTPGKPTGDGWRVLTDAEKKERGLPADKAYQIGGQGANLGKIMPVGGQAAVTGKAGKPAGVTLAAHNTAVTSLTDLIKQARRIGRSPAFNQATGSMAGRLPSVRQSSVDFDKDLESYRDKSVINTLKAMKEASPNGASGFGSLTEKEGERLQNAQGPLSQTSPETLRRTLGTNEHDAMVSLGLLYNIPAEATQMLIRNPTLMKAFDQKYGPGMARRVLVK